MIAVDTNVILHLLVRSQSEHQKAKDWILKNQDLLATTGTNIAEVLRLLTHPRVFQKPLSLQAAIHLVRHFVEEFKVAVLEESEDWWLDLEGILKVIPTLRGNEIFDARIALCLRHHGVKEICTLDTDFLKYPFLKVVPI